MEEDRKTAALNILFYPKELRHQFFSVERLEKDILSHLDKLERYGNDILCYSDQEELFEEYVRDLVKCISNFSSECIRVADIGDVLFIIRDDICLSGRKDFVLTFIDKLKYLVSKIIRDEYEKLFFSIIMYEKKNNPQYLNKFTLEEKAEYCHLTNLEGCDSGQMGSCPQWELLQIKKVVYKLLSSCSKT